MRDAADVLLTLAEPLAIPSELRTCPLSERLDADVARLLREGLEADRTRQGSDNATGRRAAQIP